MTRPCILLSCNHRITAIAHSSHLYSSKFATILPTKRKTSLSDNSLTQTPARNKNTLCQFDDLFIKWNTRTPERRLLDCCKLFMLR